MMNRSAKVFRKLREKRAMFLINKADRFNNDQGRSA